MSEHRRRQSCRRSHCVDARPATAPYFLPVTRFEKFADLFNEAQLVEALGEVADDYTYIDPVFGTVEGREAHLKVMQQVLAAYPDRAITVIGVWSAGDVEFAEYRWVGTPAAGGDTIDSSWAVVAEYRAGRLLRQRHYRG